MRFLSKWLCGLVLSITALPAMAAGLLFVDPSYPGEGWTFENQKDTVAVAWYTYDNAGNSTWAIGLLNQTHSFRDGGPLSILSGDLNEIASRNSVIPRGALSMERVIFDGEIQYTVRGNGFTRLLRPYNYNHVDLVDQFNGFWVITLFDPATLGERSNTLTTGVEFTTLGTLPNTGLTTKSFINTQTGTRGFIYYNDLSARYEGAIAQYTGIITMFRGYLQGETFFGAAVNVTAAGVSIPGTERLISANSPAPTDGAANVLFDIINSGDLGKNSRTLDVEMLPIGDIHFQANAAEALDVAYGKIFSRH